MPLKQVNLRTTEARLARIDERAKELGMSRNEWINRVLDHALLTVTGSIAVTENRRITL
jgi:hypothetical protein